MESYLRSLRIIRIQKVAALTALAIIAGITLAGCEELSSRLSILKGELLGNKYTISEYDNFGNKVMTVKGDKITLEGGEDSNGEASSYIDITIDGHEWNHVGNTLVFAQDDADMITDFQIAKEIESNGTSTGLMGVDKVINNYRNSFGKKTVVVIYSQTGAPIGLFQGDKCYTETPANLPKTTLISIDGDLVYVHRANVDILPAALLDS